MRIRISIRVDFKDKRILRLIFSQIVFDKVKPLNDQFSKSPLINVVSPRLVSDEVLSVIASAIL